MNRLIQLRRTYDVDGTPAALAAGEIALGLGTNPPRIWLGIGGGAVQEFVSGGKTVATDHTLSGDGTANNPLSVAALDCDGGVY